MHTNANGRSKSRAGMGALALLALTAALTMQANAGVSTPAYSFAGTVNTGGSSQSGTATVSISAAGTLSSIQVLTQGVPGKDFTLSTGGTCATGTTYSVSQTCTVSVNFQPTYPGVRQGAVVLVGSGNTVLGTQLLLATGVGATGVFVPGTMTTLAGDNLFIYGGDGVQATAASLYLPMGGAADAAGNIYIADSQNQRIRMVNATGIISTVAGNGNSGFLGDGGAATSAQLNAPSDVKLDGAGNLYIADSTNHVVRMVNALTHVITTVAGTGGQPGYTGDGGQATTATLDHPSALAFDGDHSLYISDTNNNAIRKLDLTTGIITTVAGTGTYGFSGDGGAATAAKLNAPWGIALAGDGTLYIADQANNRIRKVTTAGTISTVAGSNTLGYFGDSGPATQAQLDVPGGVVVDVAGNIYIADSGNKVVRKVSLNGTISTVAGIAGGGPPVDGWPATYSGLDGPFGLFLDGPGNLYIASIFQNRIRMVSANLLNLSYPLMRVGRVSSPQTVTLENDGNAGMTFSAFNLVSNSALDVATTTCLITHPIAVDESCAMGVEFAPTTTGSLVTGELDAASNAANSPGVVNLSGQVISVQPTQATLTTNLNPAQSGSAITFTVVIANGLSVPPTGTVDFYDGATDIGTGTLDANGATTFTTSSLTTGAHSMTAVYSGDSQNNVATSAVLNESVRQPTTTSLTANPNPGVAATSVTFTATVAGPNGSSVVPGGTVTFSDGATQIGVGTLNGAGVATLAISTLNGGQHTITANYGGDSQDLASQSVVLTETMAKATPTASLATSNATVYVGVSVMFTSTVTRTDGVIPTGTVTFLDGTNTLGTGTLNGSGTATLTTAALSGGVHSITAVYGGDANTLAATSPAVSQTVLTVATATAFSASANPAIAGAVLQLTATVAQNGSNGAGGPFSGTMTFFDGATPIGTATVSAGGVATLSVTSLAIGTHSLSAGYGGNVNYGTSTSTSLVETISLATSATTLISSAAPSIAGTPLLLTATVTGNGGIATGTVRFMDGATALGTGTLNGAGAAYFTTSNLAIGQHTLTAVYIGDAKNGASTSTALNQVVQIATSTTTSISSSNPSSFGASVTFTASVTTNGGAATGTVTFSDGGTPLGTAALNGGLAVFSSSTLALGPHAMTATYSGDTDDAASSSATLNQQVQQAGPVTLASSVNPSIALTNVSLTATIAAPQGAAVTGTVTFKEGSTTLGTATVNAGSAVFTTAALSVGTHTIVAVYSGDVNNRGASSNNLLQVVQTASTSVTASAGANPATAGSSLVLTGVVVGTGGNVTGTVTFMDGATALGSATVNSSGVATLSVVGLSPGRHTILAGYGGDANNVPSTSVALLETVMQTTTAVISSSENPALALDSVTLTARVSNTGSVAPTGTVIFSDGGAVLGSGTLNGAGLATFTTTSLVPRQHSITAVYSGDPVNFGTTAAAFAQTVQLRPTSDTVTGSSTSLTGGQQVTLISVVHYAGPVPPTGSVTFTSNGILLGSGVLDNTGVATLTVNPLMSSPTVIASYSGDAVYAASVSPQTGITVAKPTQFWMQLNPTAVTLQSKQNATTTLTVTSVNGFTDTLDLGCLGLPYAATCTFATDRAALTPNGTQTIRVVVDTGSPLTAGSVAKLEQHTRGSLATLCLLPGGALLGLMFWRGRRRLRSSLGGLLLVLLVAVMTGGLSGCGGLNINGTPAGTYTFQVSATGLGTGVSQAIDVTLTVTQ
ncbi:MAG TPA: Ig-like domain repeat protein [Acidobacteriaceae bacterium]|nr:Ig-like domain repeat protein [Acidobacteriaceae bacterium]